MCANEDDYANCKAVFEDDENVTVIEMATDDAWFRDTGATYVINGKGDKRACDWHFNAYGGLIDGLYFPWNKSWCLLYWILIFVFSSLSLFCPYSSPLDWECILGASIGWRHIIFKSCHNYKTT